MSHDDKEARREAEILFSHNPDGTKTAEARAHFDDKLRAIQERVRQDSGLRPLSGDELAEINANIAAYRRETEEMIREGTQGMDPKQAAEFAGTIRVHRALEQKGRTVPEHIRAAHHRELPKYPDEPEDSILHEPPHAAHSTHHNSSESAVDLGAVHKPGSHPDLHRATERSSDSSVKLF